MFFFYPLDFTFVCPTEITAFSDRIQEFKAINCEVRRYVSRRQDDHHCPVCLVQGLRSCYVWGM